MLHNFRWHLQNGVAVGACAFIAKTGSGSGTGAPEAPFNNVYAYPENQGPGNLVVGAGNYPMEGRIATNHRVYADGLVQIQGNNLVLYKNYGGPYDTELYDFRIVVGQSLQLAGTDNLVAFLNRCFVKAQNNLAGAVLLTSGGTNPAAESCIFKGMLDGTGGNLTRFTRCLFFNSNLAVFWVKNCYTDPLSTMTVQYPADCSNNNIRGPIMVAGTFYPTLAAAKAADATWFPGCVSVDPRFNNSVREDYTLRLDSPHLAAGIGPVHLRYAQGWYLASTLSAGQVCTPSNTWLVNSSDGSIVNFLALTGFSWSQQGSIYITENTANNFQAHYRISPVQVAAVAQILRAVPVLTGYNFDTSFPATFASFDSNQPDVQNNNVPVALDYASGDAGVTPHRLTIAMRWSTRQTPVDALATDWVTGATFLPFEIGSVPSWNQATNRGNGDQLFDASPANVQNVRALWVQIEYRAINNYFSS